MNIPERNTIIVSEHCQYSLNSYQTRCNNNVIVVGGSGAGKTRTIVTPNILQANSSYIISDPKGNLYGKYASYLREEGYQVRKLNLADPSDPESSHYNFCQYIQGEQDILRLSHILAYIDGDQPIRDKFWDEASELLFTAFLAYMHEGYAAEYNFHMLMKLIGRCSVDPRSGEAQLPMPSRFSGTYMEDWDSLAFISMKKLAQAPDRTLRSILISASAKFAPMDTSAIQRITQDDTMHLERIGLEKTAVFINVSDTDRSMDFLANVFFSQALQVLVREADKQKNQRFSIPVQFILDDFATNVRISDFPRVISSIRSRNISTMLLLQAESQLHTYYGSDAETIIGNCDTYVYLGTNDLDTASSIARRTNRSLQDILYMPVGENWVFRRGQLPVQDKNFDIESFLRYIKHRRRSRKHERKREVRNGTPRRGAGERNSYNQSHRRNMHCETEKYLKGESDYGRFMKGSQLLCVQ